MSKLFFSDPHWTDNPLESYRFDFVDWLIPFFIPNNISQIYILGDLTEKKDRHSEWLINKIESIIYALSNYAEVFIITGNHDCISKSTFKFLGKYNNVNFYDEPEVDTDEDILFLPYTKTPTKDWEDFRNHWTDFKFILMHQTVDGSYTHNGYILSSDLKSSYFDYAPGVTIFSGDIHTPQKIGNVEYIGSPYPVYFGDEQKGRVVIIRDDGTREDLAFPTIKRHMLNVSSLEELKGVEIRENDQVKIRVILTQDSLHTYLNIKDDISTYIDEIGAKLVTIELTTMTSITSGEIAKIEDTKSIKDYVEKMVMMEGLGNYYLETAMDIVNDRRG
jgi:DNA repair exonuclease SbcCD nuclease subunit